MKLGLLLLPAFFADASEVKQPSRTDFATSLVLDFGPRFLVHSMVQSNLRDLDRLELFVLLKS